MGDAVSAATAFLQSLGDAIVAEARVRIAGGASGRAAAAISIESVSDTQVVIKAEAPASYLIAGWPRAPMTWLIGKTVAFTPRGGDGRIVRRVTAESIAEGHWVRPARAADDVLTAAWQAPATQSLADFLVGTPGSSTSPWQPVRSSSSSIPDIL